MMLVTAFSSSSRQLTQIQVTSYREARSTWMALARSEPGSAELSTTRKGFPSSFSSVMTRSSASG